MDIDSDYGSYERPIFKDLTIYTPLPYLIQWWVKTLVQLGYVMQKQCKLWHSIIKNTNFKILTSAQHCIGNWACSTNPNIQSLQ